MTNLAVIIPARKGSKRFPGKVIHPILGKPLILWVVEGASRSNLAGKVIVATDDEGIAKIVRDAGYEAEMTRDDHLSGTDRVWEVAAKLDADWIVNLQGDEPLVTGDVIDSLADIAQGDDGSGIEMATLVRPLDPLDANNPNRVKVVIDKHENALYFSRSPIPYNPASKSTGITLAPEYFLHIGIYLYRRDILKKFVGLEQGVLEKTERLEQLRALENGIKIRCIKTGHEFLGVDTPEDVPAVEAALRAKGFKEE
jgi:3-deoxy-manno-octulosonate cytidylyltransferase (CMP-KDO synthetase)